MYTSFNKLNINYKLQLVDGEVKKSKVRATMKLCVRHISAAINRSASRNIFLKATKMVNSARHHAIPNKTSPLPLPATLPPLLPPPPRRTYSNNSNYKS